MGSQCNEFKTRVIYFCLLSSSGHRLLNFADVMNLRYLFEKTRKQGITEKNSTGDKIMLQCLHIDLTENGADMGWTLTLSLSDNNLF